jgi:hypothetical protein
MSHDFAEADWKKLRALHPIALDRFCQRVLEEVGTILADSSRSHHQRYLAVYRLVGKRDRELADAFNDMRRSRALLRISRLRGLGVLSDDEFAGFSEATRGSVQSILRLGEDEEETKDPTEV